MITNLTYEEMKKAIDQGAVCGVCGSQLTIAWGGAYGCNRHILKCFNNILHNVLARPYEPSAYDLPDQATMLNLIGGRKRQMEKELGHEKTTQLIKYAGVSALTKDQATDILKTIWPEAPAIEIYKAALLCWQYRLNPLRKHVALMCFNKGKENESWATAIGIKADRLIAHRAGSFSYIDNTPRVMTEEEQKTILGSVDPGVLWTIIKVRDNKGNEAVGYGTWPHKKLIWKEKAQVEVDNQPYGADKGNTKFNMSCIRGERQALDRLRPGEMPADVEVMDERYVDTPSGSVNVITGEIVEGSAKDGDEPPVVEFEDLQSASASVASKRDPNTVRTLTELMKVCHDDFKLQPAQVLAELGVSSQSLIVESPAACYTRIAAVRLPTK